jgi:hypothetical protein
MPSLDRRELLMDEILEAVDQEGLRVIEVAHDRGVLVRVVGGVAVSMHAEGGLPGPLQRDYKDLDLVTVPGNSGDVQQLLVSLGYEPNDSFNALNGALRLLFYDRIHGRQVDVFVGQFRMCHEIPIRRERLELDGWTLPLAELLLTKLQIASLNRKDLVDIYGLTVGHEVANIDENTINSGVVADLLAKDWGLWRTSRQTIERSLEHLGDFALEPELATRIRARLEHIWNEVELRPKGARWRARARLGDRMRWYEEPDEVAQRGEP